MGKLLRLALITLFVGSGVLDELAADSPLADVPAPKPPLVARAPDQSAWVIVVTPVENGAGSASNSKAKTLRAQLWTKSGTAMQCANEWSDGTRTEDTVTGPTKFAQSPDGKGVHIYDPKVDPRYHDFSAGDFERLDWLTPDNYVAAVNHAGERCYLYQSKGAGANAAGGESEPHNLNLAQINAPRSPTTVYISISTGLPVEIDNATDKYLFQFGAPGELKMPDVQPPAPPAPPAPHPPPPSKPRVKAPPSAPKTPKKPAPSGQTNAPSAASDL